MSNSNPAPRAPRPPELEAALDGQSDAETLRTVWDAIPRAEVAMLDVEERDAAWQRLQARLRAPGRAVRVDDAAPVLALHATREMDRSAAPVSERGPVRGTSTWRRLTSLAAGAALLLGAGAATWRAVPVTYDVARGGMPQLVRLDDGSRVTVAAGSRLRVSRALGWPGPLGTRTRTVSLEGEGFFDVARDGRPFLVRTSDAEVEVLGTRFDVRSPVDAMGSRVTVAEGRVAVRAARGSLAAVELTKGMGVSIEGERLDVRRLPVGRVGAWRDGGLAAVDEPLVTVFAELSRRFAVEIALDATVDGTMPVSLFYPTVESLESLLTDLCTAEALTWSRTSRGYRIASGSRTR